MLTRYLGDDTGEKGGDGAVHHQGARAAGGVRRRDVAGGVAVADGPHDPGPAARADPRPRCRRQQHVLARGLLAEPLPAGAVRRLLPALRRRRGVPRRRRQHHARPGSSSSHTAPSPWPATSATGSSSTCRSRGTAPTACRGRSPTTSPAPSGAWPATRWPGSPPRTPASRGPTTTARTSTASPGEDFNQPDGYVDHLILDPRRQRPVGRRGRPGLRRHLGAFVRRLRAPERGSRRPARHDGAGHRGPGAPRQGRLGLLRTP